MTRTRFDIALARTVDVLQKTKQPMNISQVAEATGLNWKMADKALRLLIKISEYLDGRSIRCENIGGAVVYRLDSPSPNVQYADESLWLYPAWDDINTGLDKIESGFELEMSVDQMDGLALIHKGLSMIGEKIGTSRPVSQHDMFVLRKVVNMIEGSFQTCSGISPATLMQTLDSYFKETGTMTSRWGRGVFRQVRKEWFEDYEQSSRDPQEAAVLESPEDFLEELKEWIRQEIWSHENNGD